MKKIISIIVIVFTSMSFLSAQEVSNSTIPNQTVKGVLHCKQTQQPIVNASIAIRNSKLGALTKTDGSFRIVNVPVGRYTIIISAIGYESITNDIVVSSGRQVSIDLEMNETIFKGKDVTVSAQSDKLKTINESVLISGTMFTLEDTKRFAGSREDPARMAGNFAGVVSANTDRNDIIVRGGSPIEVLWRLDGMDIPNPNHFATQGATGGPINMINSNLLNNSDFLTGAMPSEYGNKLSAAFDLRTRKGNSEKLEFAAQMGFAGFESVIEGPLINNGSFIVSYRKSTLEVLNKLGINFGFDGVPKYDDGMIKLDLPISSSDNLSVTTLLGSGNIAILKNRNESITNGDLDIYNGSDLVSTSVSWQHIFNEKLVSKLLLGYQSSSYYTNLDSLTADPLGKLLNSTPWSIDKSSEGYHLGSLKFSYAPSSGNFITAGTELRNWFYDLGFRNLTTRLNNIIDTTVATGKTLQSLSFINWNYRPTENLTINSGINAQYLGISKKFSIEPRLSASLQLDDNNSINFGSGIFRQAQPLMVYFGNPLNQNLDFTQAIHFVLGYNFRLNDDWLFKAETYYKDYNNAPVKSNSTSAYSLLNSGSKFNTIRISYPLNNLGTGLVYGVDMSIIKHFSDGYYLTASGSLFKQKYTGSDKVNRDGSFDNRYVGNIVAGYELKLSPGFSIEFSAKYLIAGGAPYTPIQPGINGNQFFSNEIDSLTNTLRNPDYKRFDLRIDLRNNFGGFSFITFFSMENAFNTKNIGGRFYDSGTKSIKDWYYTGRFPIGGFRVEF